MSQPVESKHSSVVIEAILLAQAPKQWERFQKNELKRTKGKVKWQREIEEMNSRVADVNTQVEELRRRYDPVLMEINAKLSCKYGVSGRLKCPVCGEENHGNTMNGKAWCMKCNVPLESHFLVKKHLPNIKKLPKTRRLNVTFRRLDE